MTDERDPTPEQIAGLLYQLPAVQEAFNRKPGLWDRTRGLNWWLVSIGVGLLILWTLIIVAVVREFT